MKRAFLVLLLLLTQAASAQTDKRLAALFERMDYWAEYCEGDTTDSKIDMLHRARTNIYDMVCNIIKTRPDGLTGEFPLSKKKGLKYVTSQDNRLRIYSWPVRTEIWNVPRLVFDNIAGYRTGKQNKCLDLDESGNGNLFLGITTVYTQEKKAVYLATYHNDQYSNITCGIKAYTIEGGKLVATPFFDTGTELLKDLWYQYDLSDAVQSGDVHFNADGTKLFMPNVKDAGHATQIDSFTVFNFDGHKFVQTIDHRH